MSPAGVALPPGGAPRRRRPGCCCLSCLIVLALSVLVVGGVLAYGWYRTRPAASPVEKEYEQVPSYFPPTPPAGAWSATP